MIGKHFPNVDDRLLNLLELSENPKKSDLLMASIEQRATDLKNLSFVDAVNVRESLKYARYILIPVGILAVIWVTGDVVSFFNSHKRVLNYDVAYERPAPFVFEVLNTDLEVLDNEALTIEVRTIGEVRPNGVQMVAGNERLVMQERNGVYVYTFQPPVGNFSFYLTANGWNSRRYQVTTFETPTLVDFSLQLDYPSYLKRSSEVLSGTGNAEVPEGSRITWKISGSNVEEIDMITKDTLQSFQRDGSLFSYQMRLFDEVEYELTTSNKKVRDFERLAYRLGVISDQKAIVQVNQITDSLNPNEAYFAGQAADDYGLREIRAVVYPSDDKQSVQRLVLDSPKGNVTQFYYTFPSGLAIETGKSYKIYFEVVDNDGIRGGKVTQSEVFDAVLYDDNQLNNKELEFQNTTLNKLGESLKNMREQEEKLSEINQLQKEEKALNFEEKSQIRNFLQQQQMQEQLMEKFSQDLNKSIDKNEEDSEMKRMIQERLERQEAEARKNAKLLEELEKIAEKIDKEELQQRLEELGKNQGKNTRNLEQILELTKRYYVTEKASQIAKELEELARKQETLSELKLGEDFSDKEQKMLNEEFESLEKEIRDLEKDNQELKKPIELDMDETKTGAIKQDQQDALEEINKHQGMEESSQSKEKEDAGNNATKKQKSAAQKMREMSESLKSGASGGGQSDAEDAEMLRQILDNLVTFSFKQENLFDNIQSADVDISQFSKTVKGQQDLRRLFEHVDDSLFALSLRRAELSEFVNEQITEVYYNIDKSLESIADNQIYQGASYQQYVINATNALADFLANVLDNMQQNMSPGQGSGQGQDFQLPDIIKGQQGIQEKMNESGKQGQQSEGEGEQDGKNEGGNKQGEEGNTGEGENGQKGQNGKTGIQKGTSESNGNGLGEMDLNEVYEIYKEQQFLRQNLERQLENMINESDRNLATKLMQQMEDFENDLLENGITNRTRSKANNIQHQLMKLENASLEQGQKKERESKSNLKQYSNPITTKPGLLERYQNDVEILNRQALPLRKNYERKVKLYFDNDRVPFQK
jgi:ribosomal protein L11